MIKSMTGFASLTRETPEGVIGVTVRTVNHRYLDLQLRLPPLVAHLEPRLRTLTQRKLSRGRVEVSVSLQSWRLAQVEVELNEALLEALTTSFESARTRGLVQGSLTPGDLLRIPQALTIRERQADPESDDARRLGEAVEAAVEQALDELNAMRAREGALLQADLDARQAALGDMVRRAADAAEGGRVALEARLGERVREMAVQFQVEPATIAQEIVRFAARSDISEETVRFDAHLDQWARLVDGIEPCGRKLDFLLQEMHREVNTLGSKADGPGVPELIVAIKAELEKVREQVQNVE
jgi:uncharacterized protein (TIGR00255 family)